MRFGSGSVVLAGAVLVACGGKSERTSIPAPPEAPGIEATGRRLEVRQWRHGEESLPSTMYDTELDVECDFRLAGDGVERCLPADFGVIHFGDADCLQPIALAPRGCDGSSPRYARLRKDVESCHLGSADDIYRVGEPVPRPPEIFSVSATGTCEADRERGDDYYAATLVAPDTFVRGNRIVAPRTAELGTEMIVTDDGLELPLAVYDLSREQECQFMRVEGDGPSEFRCMNNLASSDAFSEDCAGGLAVSFRPRSCGSPEIVVATAFSECSSEPSYELFELGSKEPESYVSPAGFGCRPDDGPDAFPAYAIGPARSAQGFAAVNLEPVGASRLQRLHYTSEGTSLLAEAFWDASLEARCEPRRVANGRTYCVPETLRKDYDSARYADADCTVPLLAPAPDGCEASDSPSLLYRSGNSDDGCYAEFATFHRLEPFDADGHYRLHDDGACAFEQGPPELEYFLVSEEVPAEDVFVELTLE